MARILKIWHTFSPVFHLVGLILTITFTAGIVYAGAARNNERITTLETAKNHQTAMLTRMDYNIQIIAHKVGVTPLEPSPEERDRQ